MRYFLLCFLTILPGLLAAQVAQNSSGNWNVAGNWDGNNIGDDISEDVNIDQNVSSTIINGDDYTIGSLTLDKSTVTINGSGNLTIGSEMDPGFFSAMNNATLIINGDFELWGDFVVNNSLNITVTGNFIIRGDIELKNGAGFNVDGDMIVEGDFTGGNNATFNVNGSIDIGGDLSIGTGPTLTYGPDGVFTVGGTCTGPVSFCSALPVELVSFNAFSLEREVLVRWATASEINNDFFTLQVSTDGIEYRDIVRISGAGNSSARADYEFTDVAPIQGKAYYRLTQTDFDGTHTVFDPILVDRSHLQQPMLYPNPVNPGQTVKLFTGGSSSDQVDITVRTLQGQRIWAETLTGSQHNLDLSDRLNSGIYIIEMTNGIRRQLHRLVVK